MADRYAGVSDAELLDLAISTSQRLDPPALLMVFGEPKYDVVNHLFEEERIMYGGGEYAFEQKLSLDETGHARFVRPYEQTQPITEPNLVHLRVPWKHTQMDYTMSRHEMLVNAGKERLVDELELKEKRALGDGATLIERCFFQPLDLSDDRRPFGLQYWFPKPAAGEDIFGFYGGTPDGVADVGGIVPTGDNTGTLTTTTGAKDNWNHLITGGSSYYTGVVDDLTLRTTRKIMAYINFQQPKWVNGKVLPESTNYRIWTGRDQHLDLLDYLEDKGDLIVTETMTGNQVRQGQLSRYNVVGIPILDDDATNPWYFVNMNTFGIAGQEGNFMHRSDPMRGVSQHLVITWFVDLTYNTYCSARKWNAVMATT